MLEYSPTQRLLNRCHLLSIAQHTWPVTSPDSVWAGPSFLLFLSNTCPVDFWTWEDSTDSEVDCVCAALCLILLLVFFSISFIFFPKNEEQVMMHKPLRSPSELYPTHVHLFAPTRKEVSTSTIGKVLTSNSTLKPWFDNLYKELCVCDGDLWYLLAKWPRTFQTSRANIQDFHKLLEHSRVPSNLLQFSWVLSWNLWSEPLTVFQNLMTPTMATIQDQHETTWEKGSNPARFLPL